MCEDTEIPITICHHFGMFDFNTVSEQEFEKQFAKNTTAVRPYVLQPEYIYYLDKKTNTN